MAQNKRKSSTVYTIQQLGAGKLSPVIKNPNELSSMLMTVIVRVESHFDNRNILVRILNGRFIQDVQK